jgi:transcriptional regulator with XRE-family HTH domain
MFTKSCFDKLEKQYGPLTFGGLMKAWREAEEMTQTAFAKRVGLSVQNLNDLEKSRRIPTATRAARIAKNLGLPEMRMIQIALRDSLEREGFKYEVKLEQREASKRMGNKRNVHTGSSLSDFLESEGLETKVSARTTKRMLVDQAKNKMKPKKQSRS